jgi:hypothetical protein
VIAVWERGTFEEAEVWGRVDGRGEKADWGKGWELRWEGWVGEIVGAGEKKNLILEMRNLRVLNF